MPLDKKIVKNKATAASPKPESYFPMATAAPTTLALTTIRNMNINMKMDPNLVMDTREQAPFSAKRGNAAVAVERMQLPGAEAGTVAIISPVSIQTSIVEASTSKDQCTSSSAKKGGSIGRSPSLLVRLPYMGKCTPQHRASKKRKLATSVLLPSSIQNNSNNGSNNLYGRCDCKGGNHIHRTPSVFSQRYNANSHSSMLCLGGAMGFTSTKLEQSYIEDQRCINWVDETIHMSPTPKFTNDELRMHILSLRTEGVMRAVRPLLARLLQHPSNYAMFNSPVDVVALKLPDYHNIIKNPMDLGTIKTRLMSMFYVDLEAFAADVRLVFDNARRYNPPKHYVHERAKAIAEEFESEYEKIRSKTEKTISKLQQHSCGLCQGSECILCGEKCLKLEAAPLFCHGFCGLQIKKGSVYYATKDGNRLWCQRCYTGLAPVLSNIMDDDEMESWEDCEQMQHVGSSSTNSNSNINKNISSCSSSNGNSNSEYSTNVEGDSLTRIFKRDLIKKKFDEEIPEAWVQCDSCEQWMHSICALYNSRASFEENPAQKFATKFYCPMCRMLARMAIQEEEGLEVYEDRKPRIAASHTTAMPGTPACSSTSPFFSTSSVASSAVTSTSTSLRQKSVSYEDPTEYCNGDTDGDEDDDEGDDALGVKQGKQKASPALSASQAAQQIQQNDIDLSSSSVRNCMKGSDAHIWEACCLPNSHLGKFIESGVRLRLHEQGQDPSVGDSITIRVVSNVGREFDVPETIRKYFHFPGGAEIPASISYRSKSIMMFQKIDGVDICLFTMYVQEYDRSCPEPNSRRVYIAYLDSVEYFRPRSCRTLVYYEILSHYLLWCRLRGFRTANIWACPPQKGNNFIYWAHPLHQKTPTKDRLIAWYKKMIERTQEIGAVQKISDLYLENFKDFKHGGGDSSSVACPPLFDGDYWIDEACRLHSINVKKKFKHNTNRFDQSTPWHLCVGVVKVLLNHTYGPVFKFPVDPVAAKAPDYFNIIKKPMDLGTIQKKLRHGEYSTYFAFAEDVRLVFKNAKTYNPVHHVVHTMALTLDSIFEDETRMVLEKCGYRKDVIDMSSIDALNGMIRELILSDSLGYIRSRVAAIYGYGIAKSEVEILPPVSNCEGTWAKSGRPLSISVDSTTMEILDQGSMSTSIDADCDDYDYQNFNLPKELSKSIEKLKSDMIVLQLHSSDNQQDGDVAYAVKSMPHVQWALENVSFGDTTDPDEKIHSPLTDSRATFLETMQHRYYQFDSLRRAKYSSQMILYHLHNVAARSLFTYCKICEARIAPGDVRWHCQICTDMDVCSNCKSVSHNYQDHGNHLTPYKVTYGSINTSSPTTVL